MYPKAITHKIDQKNFRFMLHRKVIFVYSEIHTTHVNIQCTYNAEYFNVKLRDA